MPETSLRPAIHLEVEAAMAAVEEEPVAEAEQVMTGTVVEVMGMTSA